MLLADTVRISVDSVAEPGIFHLRAIAQGACGRSPQWVQK